MNITISTTHLAMVGALALLAWNVLLTLYVRRNSRHLDELQGWSQRSFNRLIGSVRKLNAKTGLGAAVVTQRLDPNYDPSNATPNAVAFERAEGLCNFVSGFDGKPCVFAAIPGTERCAAHLVSCTCGVDSGAAPGDHNPRCAKYDGAAPVSVKP